MKKKHAKHNQELSEKLLKEKGYFDWAITSAFYSALHYLEYELFPLDYNGKNYATLPLLCTGEFGGPNAKPHRVRLDLIRIRLPEIYPYYNALFGDCHNARYKDYQVKPLEATLACNRLDSIVKLLKKP
jgi:hypothetical protein